MRSGRVDWYAPAHVGGASGASAWLDAVARYGADWACEACNVTAWDAAPYATLGRGPWRRLALGVNKPGDYSGAPLAMRAGRRGRSSIVLNWKQIRGCRMKADK